MSDTITFGVHLLFDAYGCDEKKLADKEFLHQLLSGVPEKMGMHSIYDPVVIEVGELNKKDPGGISGFVLIAESHFSFHTFPKRRFLTADFYTCQDSLDSQMLIDYLAQEFAAQHYDTTVVKRGTKYPKENLF